MATTPFRGRKKGEKLDPLPQRLARLGLVRDWDFILHLPLRYEDETKIVPIARLIPGESQQCEGQVLRCERIRRPSGEQLQAVISDGTGNLVVRLLHFYPSQVKQLAAGSTVRLYGPVREGFLGLEMVHPKIKTALLGAKLPTTLTPVYPAGEGITQTWLRKRIARALFDVEIKELMPASLLQKLQLPGLPQALNTLHHPPVGADLQALSERTDPAWQRIKFDELVAQQIALRRSRELKATKVAPVIATARQPLTERLLQSLPFQLTRAQRRVLDEIGQNLAKSTPMNRLVQGDVGSGKTIVAALAATMAIDAGYQTALMAPTEILAEQHYEKLSQWLQPIGVRIAWLAGKQKSRERQENLSAIADGSAQMVIGTHALIQESVHFHRLGLAIIDEQHRFGVAQRLALREGNQEQTPHLLMLSATPIPRTLAMSYLADVDVSVIDELPPGRHPVTTKLVSLSRKRELLDSIAQQVAQGRQVYWVCPLIEESEKLDLTAATETFKEISSYLPNLSVGLVHGALPPEQKQAVMQSFKDGRIDVLVATTVIEVGVDVPNASLMVIEHAERFGLAQLHQLRGRVGRGAAKSFCILLYGELSETGKQRLKVIRESNDGFEIAQRDLEIRGPGEFLGARQSGIPLLRFADLQRDAALVETARDFAAQWIRLDPESATKHVKRWFSASEAFLGA
ncbi:MAG TPA: ATP-dependent DNA helicase RecG [Candidatus Aphodousia gallistercoris]|nr:ATP-dependent DNA helicase RecG [Candidatus Aphodousia gallistercoris]